MTLGPATMNLPKVRRPRAKNLKTMMSKRRTKSPRESQQPESDESMRDRTKTLRRLQKARERELESARSTRERQAPSKQRSKPRQTGTIVQIPSVKCRPTRTHRPSEVESQLRKIAFAMISYQDSHRVFPIESNPKWFDAQGKPYLYRASG